MYYARLEMFLSFFVTIALPWHLQIQAPYFLAV